MPILFLCPIHIQWKMWCNSSLTTLFRLHGFPTEIISDRDRIFASNMYQQLFAALKIKLKFSKAYHPQRDGQTEQVNQNRLTRLFASNMYLLLQKKEWCHFFLSEMLFCQANPIYRPQRNILRLAWSVFQARRLTLFSTGFLRFYSFFHCFFNTKLCEVF